MPVTVVAVPVMAVPVMAVPVLVFDERPRGTVLAGRLDNTVLMGRSAHARHGDTSSRFRILPIMTRTAAYQ